MNAWEEVYNRWRSAPLPSGNQNSSFDNGERQNYTGFLCALGGVCLKGSVIMTAKVYFDHFQKFRIDNIYNYSLLNLMNSVDIRNGRIILVNTIKLI